MRLLVLLVVAVISAACSEDKARVEFRMLYEDRFLGEHLEVDARAGSWRIDVTGADFGPASSIAFTTPSEGHLIVRVSARLEEDASHLIGEVELAIRAGWIWRVDFATGLENPIDQCIGCGGSAAFALPATVAPDSLFVVWTQTRLEGGGIVF